MKPPICQQWLLRLLPGASIQGVFPIFLLERLDLWREPLTASRRFDRAALYIEAGKADEAAKIMQQLIDEGYEFKRDYYQSADPVMLEEEIIFVFRKLSEQSQNDVDKLYDYGIVLRQFGFHSQALRVQREGQVLDASNPRIKQEISFLEKILLLPKKREGKRSNGLEKNP
jgi:tetratricopeptide (TPR) repeat protein